MSSTWKCLGLPEPLIQMRHCSEACSFTIDSRLFLYLILMLIFGISVFIPGSFIFKSGSNSEQQSRVDRHMCQEYVVIRCFITDQSVSVTELRIRHDIFFCMFHFDYFMLLTWIKFRDTSDKIAMT